MAGDGERLLELSQSPEFIAGARVTIIFALVFIISILGQVYAKISAIKAYKKSKSEVTETSTVYTPINNDGDSKKTYAGEASVTVAASPAANQNERPKRFNRYASDNPILLASDRVIGNYVEWSVPFLSVFWMSILLTGKGEVLGYAYCACRLIYMILAFNGGIKPSGPAPMIFPATVSMYLILIVLGTNAAKAAFS